MPRTPFAGGFQAKKPGGANLCACGCGERTNFVFRRGHHSRMPEHKAVLRDKAARDLNDAAGRARTAARNKRQPYTLARLRPTRRPTLIDIAWAAGIYEGEGSCSTNERLLSDGSPSVRLQCSVSQKDPELLHRLHALFGGNVYDYTHTYRHRPHKDGGSCVMFRWSLSGPRAHGFMLTIFSFLTERRKGQIRRALQIKAGHHA